MNLLSDSESDGEQNPNLSINRKYATNFEAKARFQDLQRGKELLEEEDDSDEESEDDDGEALSAKLDFNIMKTITSIRKKDPSIYDASKKDWCPEDSNSDDEEEKASKSKRKTYKDVVREQLLAYGAGEDDSMNPVLKGPAKKNDSLSYDKEQESLRQAFLKSVESTDKGTKKKKDAHSESEEDEMLIVKKDSKHNKKIQEDLKKSMNELLELGDDNETKNRDKFLVEYFMNEKWKNPEFNYVDRSAKETSMFGGGADSDADEEHVDQTEQFESKYNFRFQELQDEKEGSSEGLVGLQVVGHSRNVDGSLRRSDDKRKAQREAYRERKERERRVKEEELKRLKNLKKMELQKRLKKIAKVGGVDFDTEPEGTKRSKKSKKKADGEKLMIDETLLDEDWDPAKHEALMAAQFGDDYYEAGEGEFEDEQAAHAYAMSFNEEDDEGAYDQYDDDDEGMEVVVNGDDDADAVPQAVIPALKKTKRERNLEKKKKKRSLQKDADDEEGLDEAALDELYALDYEDIIGNDTLCRFKYRQVAKEDFGLEVEDILNAEDKELNQFRSIKKYSAYREKNNGVSTEDKELEKRGWRSDYNEDDAAKLSKKRKRLRKAIRDRMEEAETATGGIKTSIKTTDGEKEEEVVLPAKKLSSTTGVVKLTKTDGNSDSGSGDEADNGAAVSGKRKRKRKRKGNKSASSTEQASTATVSKEAPTAEEKSELTPVKSTKNKKSSGNHKPPKLDSSKKIQKERMALYR